MQKETKLFIGILMVVSFGIVFLKFSTEPTINENTINTKAAGDRRNINRPGRPVDSGELKEFNIVAFKYGFEPDTIRVNQGDIVKLTLSSRDIPHGFAINEYGISEYMDGLREKTVEFTADKKGTFTYYCNVPCGSGHGSMRGKLIVE